ADDASRLIPTRARQDACKPETKGAPRRSKDTPGKGSCDRERYPWFVAQFWTESRNRWRNAKLSERQSSATMSLAGRWMRRVRFGLLCRSLYRDQYASQYASQIVPSLPADPMLGEPAADPEEKRGPASDKNWSCFRLDQTEAREIGDRPPLIVERDRFGVVHSEQDLDGGINAHVIDKGADCMIACLDAQKQARALPKK